MWKALTVAAAVLAAAALVLVLATAPERTVAPVAETGTPQPTAGGDTRKVVWHADFRDPRRFSAMLTSINNMVTTYQNDLVEYDVRIVFVSHGIRFVTDDKLSGTPFAEDVALAERRQELRDRLLSLQELQGVKLELCDITRAAVGLPREKLYPGVTLVRSGVVRIAELQDQGFACLKME